MDWYYSDGRQQFGPITQAEFDALVATGRINASTLVWRAGMANWAPLGTVQQPAPAMAANPVAPAVAVAPLAAEPVGPQPAQPQQQVRFCSHCGKPFAPADLLQIGNMTVCATCKDVEMQRLREGATPGGLAFQGRQFAGFWIRAVALFVDGIILGVVSAIVDIPIQLVMAGVIGSGNTTDQAAILGSAIGLMGLMFLLNMAIGAAYEGWFVVNKGATPGKMVLSLEVIRADGTRPGWGLAIGRYFAKQLSGWILGIGYIMAGIDDEKRGLHDRICNTRVVKK